MVSIDNRRSSKNIEKKAVTYFFFCARDIDLSRKRSHHGDFSKFILLALMKEELLDLDDLEKRVSLLVSQFEMAGIEFGPRIVSSLIRN
jgi:hypothetical protein